MDLTLPVIYRLTEEEVIEFSSTIVESADMVDGKYQPSLVIRIRKKLEKLERRRKNFHFLTQKNFHLRHIFVIFVSHYLQKGHLMIVRNSCPDKSGYPHFKHGPQIFASHQLISLLKYGRTEFMKTSRTIHGKRWHFKWCTMMQSNLIYFLFRKRNASNIPHVQPKNLHSSFSNWNTRRQHDANFVQYEKNLHSSACFTKVSRFRA